jgi:hypothetical protein
MVDLVTYEVKPGVHVHMVDVSTRVPSHVTMNLKHIGRTEYPICSTVYEFIDRSETLYALRVNYTGFQHEVYFEPRHCYLFEFYERFTFSIRTNMGGLIIFPSSIQSITDLGGGSDFGHDFYRMLGLPELRLAPGISASSLIHLMRK